MRGWSRRDLKRRKDRQQVFEQNNYVGGDFTFSMKDENTLLIKFKSKTDRPDASVEYKRAD